MMKGGSTEFVAPTVFSDWLRVAQPGEIMEYAVGYNFADDSGLYPDLITLKGRVWDQAMAGVVVLSQVKTVDTYYGRHIFRYRAMKVRSPKPLPFRFPGR